jgi:hypothetical protein
MHLRYFLSTNFCAAEDMPLIEATLFFFDCLPHSEEVRRWARSSRQAAGAARQRLHAADGHSRLTQKPAAQAVAARICHCCVAPASRIPHPASRIPPPPRCPPPQLTLEQKLQIMGDLRASVHEAVADFHARQEELQRRSQARSRRTAAGGDWRLPLRAAEGGGGPAAGSSGGGAADDSEEGEEGAASRTASLAMSIFAQQWERLHGAAAGAGASAGGGLGAAAAPFLLHAGKQWRSPAQPPAPRPPRRRGALGRSLSADAPLLAETGQLAAAAEGAAPAVPRPAGIVAASASSRGCETQQWPEPAASAPEALGPEVEGALQGDIEAPPPAQQIGAGGRGGGGEARQKAGTAVRPAAAEAVDVGHAAPPPDQQTGGGGGGGGAGAQSVASPFAAVQGL